LHLLSETKKGIIMTEQIHKEQQVLELPFAPHSQSFKTSKEGCYGVFDCRIVDEYSDSEQDTFYN